MFKNFVLIAVLCTVLTGCAMGQVKPEQKASIKKIGVYSAMGPQINYDFVGLTIFSNELKQAQVSWDIDSYIAQDVVKQLKARNYDVGILSAGLQPSHSVTKEQFVALQNAAKAQGYTTMVVVRPYEQPSEQNQMHTRAGYGLLHRSIAGMMNRTYLYVLMTISVYDVASGESLGWSKGYSEWTGAPPMKILENWEWQNDFLTYSSAQIAGLDQDAKTLANTAITYAIPDMGL